MNAKNQLVLLLFIFLSHCLSAQQSVKPDTLCFCREKINLNGKVLHYNEMKPLLTKYPSSNLEFKRYMRGASWGTLALFTGVSAGVVSLIRIPKKDPFLNRYSVTFFSGTAIGLAIITATKKHLRRSVSFYNKEVLKSNN